MISHQNIYIQGKWQEPLKNIDGQLVFIFGDRYLMQNSDIQQDLKSAYPTSEIIGCTTSGEILDDRLYDDSLCLTVMKFDTSSVNVHSVLLKHFSSVYDAGKELSLKVEKDNLKYVLVLSDGQQVNGTQLIKGLKTTLGDDVLITGALAGDGTNFSETLVWYNESIAPGQIVLCCFYGPDLVIGHGTMGGWGPFGTERSVTHSEGNILYTLDDKPALELYKSYLGEQAKDLPASALLFPLLIKTDDASESVIRTILNIDESNNSMIFAGDIPQGAKAQLMHANLECLIDGAEGAAENALKKNNGATEGVALLISCVGRRLVLKQRAEEELEAVKYILGPNFLYTGFYSYGEISPFVNGTSCVLHNQTMTITTISEKH